MINPKLPEEISIKNSVCIENERITTHSDSPDNLQAARDYYVSKGFTVLNGRDFEQNMLVYVSSENPIERLLLDDYARTKIEGKRRFDVDEYAKQVIDIIGIEKIRILLHLCRMCSFLGSSRVPDMIVIDRRNKSMSFRQAGGLALEQKMFIMLANILRICDAKLVDAGSGNPAENMEFTIENLLRYAVNSEGYNNFRKKLDEITEKENEEMSKITASRKEHSGRVFIHEDEIYYLHSQKQVTPFFIFSSWLNRGVLSEKDIMENMKRIEEMNRKRQTEFKRFYKALQTDTKFMKMLPFQNYETVRRKKEHLQEKFNIGESRATELLNFMSSL